MRPSLASLAIVELSALWALSCGRPLVDGPSFQEGPPPPGCLAQVAGVYDSVFVVRRQDGTIWAAPDHDQFVQIPGPQGPFAATDLAVAGSTAYGTAVGCAIVEGGAVWCFPVAGPLVHSGDLGAGLGADVTTTAAVQVVLSADGPRAPLTGARQLAASMNGAGATFCATTDATNVLCWGYGGGGILGRGDDADATFARPVLLDATTSLANVRQVSVGFASACAVLRDSSVFCWGDNRRGQLGGGSTLDESPFAVRVDLPPVERLAADPGDTPCARLGDDRVACWGWNAYAQAGAVDTSATVGPTIVVASAGGAPLRGVRALAPDHGMQAMCGALFGGQLVCWGNPIPAPGLAAVESPFPVAVPGPGPQALTPLASFGGRDGALLWIDQDGHLAVGAGASPLAVQPPCGSR